MSRAKNRIVIEVKNGVVYNVFADEEVIVYVLDRDENDIGDKPLDGIGKSVVSKLIADAITEHEEDDPGNVE